MCECACGEFTPDYYLPGPNGIVYAIQVYHPCKECETPLGVIIRLQDRNKQVFMKPVDYGPTYGNIQEFVIPLMEPLTLCKIIDRIYDCDITSEDMSDHIKQCVVESKCP